MPLALMLSGPALAQQGGLGLYVGIGLADFGFDQDPGGLSLAVDPGVSGGLPGIRPSNGGAGPASTVVGPDTGNIDGSAAALKLVAGWNVTGNLGVEIGYSRTDELVTGYSEEVGDLTLSANIATNITLGTVRLMGYLPFGFGTAFAGLGYFDAESSSSQNINLAIAGVGGIRESVSLGGTLTEAGPTASLGMQWRLVLLTIRTEYEWFDMNDSDASQIGVGVMFEF